MIHCADKVNDSINNRDYCKFLALNLSYLCCAVIKLVSVNKMIKI